MSIFSSLSSSSIFLISFDTLVPPGSLVEIIFFIPSLLKNSTIFFTKVVFPDPSIPSTTINFSFFFS
ncbi:hypothetical protein AOQ89_00535 [bacterium endosymbiont of Pedicinus badii]|nr:hypothetical protein AOQ89_00535 [bacterium endosymbiont of Pedicinus badii]